MPADDPLILDLAGRILDGALPDWATAESSATASQFGLITELRAIAAIGVVARRDRMAIDATITEGTIWGQLRILELIGQGGGGAVYRAWDPQLDREVALKLVLTTDDRATALEEGRLLARIQHRNVVTIFGADRIDPYVGLWMEYVRGESLEDLLRRDGPFSPARVAALGGDLCEALTAIHNAGFVHRDVKAQNVMLDESGRLVLMDFGTGRSIAGHLQGIAGTPLYLAPEIFAGEAASVRSDLYSVGVLLYHLLTGRYPVEGTTVGEVREAHQRGGRAVSLRAQRPDVPKQLASAVDRLLAPDPADRFESAAELGAVLAPPRSEPARRAYIAVAAAVIVIVIGGMASGLVPTLSGVRTSRQVTTATTAPRDTPTARRVSLPRHGWVGSGLSGDGRSYAYVDEDENLVVFDMQSGAVEALVPSQGDQYPQLAIASPDGQHIAYQWWTDRSRYEIRVVDRSTKHVRVLLRDDDLDVPTPAEWARRGGEILLWLKPRQGPGRIVLLGVDNGIMQTVRELVDEPLGMSLSADGAYVAYDTPRSTRDRSRVLHIVSRNGRNDHVVPSDMNANDRFPLWTADSRLFFLSDRSGSSDGWLVPVHDGVVSDPAVLVIRNLSRVSSLGITESGAFYYRLLTGSFEINAVTLDRDSSAFKSKPARITTRFAGSNIGPAFSRDGRQLSYISVRDGLGGTPLRTLVITDLTTRSDRELSPSFTLGNAPARWSPDGSRLLVGSRIIDATTGQVVHQFNEHADRDQTDYGPTRWAADGRSVVYEQAMKGLVRHPLDGRDDEIVLAYAIGNPVERVHRFEVSPRGDEIALSGFLKQSKDSVLQVISPTGVLELTRRTRPELVVVQGWSADGRYVLFTTPDVTKAPPHEMWRVPVWGGPAERLGAIDGATQLNPVAIDPTGASLAYTAGTPKNEVWMMEAFLPPQ